MANQSKQKRKGTKRSRAQQPQWKTGSDAMRCFAKQSQPMAIAVASCIPGSNIRAVRMDEVFKLTLSFKRQGLLPHKCIHVVDRDPDDSESKYRVIDGMHRVTACQVLTEQGLEGFTEVTPSILHFLRRVYLTCVMIDHLVMVWHFDRSMP